MSKTTWHKGAPPSIGWWPAGHKHKGKRSNRLIRWWDGEFWSVAAFPDFTAVEAADCACFKALGQNLIEWTDRWWPVAAMTNIISTSEQDLAAKL